MHSTNDINREQLLSTHPYRSGICNNHELSKDKRFLRQLMEKWLFPGKFIPNNYPVLSADKIAIYSLFYYPIPESMGRFNPVSLYYRASVMYHEEKCQAFFDYAINHCFQIGKHGYDGIKSMCFVASKAEHTSILRNTYDKFILRMACTDEVEIERKVICMLCALLLNNEKDFKKAYRCVLNCHREDKIDKLPAHLTSHITSIYLPNTKAQEIAKLLNKLYTWMHDVKPSGKNFDNMYDFRLGLMRQRDESIIGSIGYQISVCMEKADVDKFASKYFDGTVGEIKLGTTTTLGCLADYWERDDVSSLPDFVVLAYKPQMLEESQLRAIPYTSYVQLDEYYYYFMYASVIPDTKFDHSLSNHLNVSGYNPELINRAKAIGVCPDYYFLDC